MRPKFLKTSASLSPNYSPDVEAELVEATVTRVADGITIPMYLSVPQTSSPGEAMYRRYVQELRAYAERYITDQSFSVIQGS